jgi:glycosyltransferase involved in cell wall biosynthesis
MLAGVKLAVILPGERSEDAAPGPDTRGRPADLLDAFAILDRAPDLFNLYAAETRADAPVPAFPGGRARVIQRPRSGLEFASDLGDPAVWDVRNVQTGTLRADPRNPVVSRSDTQQRMRPKGDLHIEGRGDVEQKITLPEFRRRIIDGYEVVHLRDRDRRLRRSEKVGKVGILGEPEFVRIERHNPFRASPPCRDAEPRDFLTLKVSWRIVQNDVHSTVPRRPLHEQLTRAIRRPVIEHEHVVDTLVEQVTDRCLDDIQLIPHRRNGPDLASAGSSRKPRHAQAGCRGTRGTPGDLASAVARQPLFRLGIVEGVPGDSARPGPHFTFPGSGSVIRLPHVCAHRVDIVNHTAQPGGAETALLRLLDAIDTERFDVGVITFEDGELVERLASRGIRTQIVPLGGLNTVTRSDAAKASGAIRNAAAAAGFVPKLARVIRRSRPDLLVAHSLKAATMLSLAAPLARTPWVWHLHDRLASDYLPGAPGVAMRALARTAPRQVVANSHATLSSIGRIRSNRASVAYPGLGAADFSPRSRPPANAVVGILGRISETKGQLEFVRAAAQLGAARTSVSFRIIGSALFQDGDYERLVRDAAQATGLSERLQFTGWTSDPGSAIRQLSLLVHASPVPEPFGQVVVEAMAAGVPVVAASAGGILEILDPSGAAEQITDGVSRSALGLLVRPGDSDALAFAMGWALDHPGEVEVMAKHARESAIERFSIEQTCRVVADAWSRALGQSDQNA